MPSDLDRLIKLENPSSILPYDAEITYRCANAACSSHATLR